MKSALAAVADETRLKTLTILGASERCACEIPKLVGVSQPAVSQHLKILLDAGLVKARKDGRKRMYSLSERGKKILRDISAW